ncbi:hypothetical protein EV702DRAFT_92430 [Suillus placidus]|uniref:Uncharacterized protein n=1 Tax=Suillus placidus TaxID=48579 RepID=A0A9P6ZI91_9AGAM|nr:hypothetical protein EV702DRAFT_92430 [Suillus placidus]
MWEALRALSEGMSWACLSGVLLISFLMADWRAEGEWRHEDTLETDPGASPIQCASGDCLILTDLTKRLRLRSGCSLEKLTSFVKNVVTPNIVYEARLEICCSVHEGRSEELLLYDSQSDERAPHSIPF